MLVTAVVELATLVVVFQWMKDAPRMIVNAVLLASLIAFGWLGYSYLGQLSLYTYSIPATGERGVKGNECSADAFQVYGKRCPDLGSDALAEAEYEAERLWTARSISDQRMRLVALWSGTFLTLSILLGSFLVYQTGVKGRQRSRQSPSSRSRASTSG